MNNSAWPASFGLGLHAALVRRIPPHCKSPELEQLSLALMEALEQGDSEAAADALRGHVAIQGEKFHSLMATLKNAAP